MNSADPLYNDWLHQQLRVQPDHLAVYDLTADRSFNWHEFNTRVDALAHWFHAAGICSGDRIAYLGLNSSDVVEIFFATLRIGAVYVPLNFRLTAPELSFIIGDCSPSAIFYDRDFSAVIDAIDAKVKPEILVETALDGSESAYEGCFSLNLPALEPEAVNADTLSMIMYSSGTTGKPKGVIYTRRKIGRAHV